MTADNPGYLELAPVTRRVARQWIATHHAHSRPPDGWRFGVSVLVDGEIVGVGCAGQPKARPLDDGRTIEITRVCTIGTPNACSRIYAALCGAAKRLGYRTAYTYTLEDECASCPRAAGFVLDGCTPGRSWSVPSRPRVEVDLFGEARTPLGPKHRWKRVLNG